MTLTHCHSVDNKWSNNSAAMHQIGPKIFVPIWAKNYVSNFFSSGKGWSCWGRGQKNSDLSSYISHLTKYWSEN